MKTDSQLKQDVLDELKWEPSVNEAHIGVTVHDGVVTLTGHVPAYAEKCGAEAAAKRVYGVRGVADELDVKLPGISKRTDEDIARACVGALKSNYLIPFERIKVLVNNGRVTLEGQVDFQFQSDAALHAVRHLGGVVFVSNNIKLKPQVSAGNVKHLIEAAFQRSAEIDARRIVVEAIDGKVILSGSVRSWAERNEAQQAAWAAPGVTVIENRLAVTP